MIRKERERRETTSQRERGTKRRRGGRRERGLTHRQFLSAISLEVGRRGRKPRKGGKGKKGEGYPLLPVKRKEKRGGGFEGREEGERRNFTIIVYSGTSCGMGKWKGKRGLANLKGEKEEGKKKGKGGILPCVNHSLRRLNDFHVRGKRKKIVKEGEKRDLSHKKKKKGREKKERGTGLAQRLPVMIFSAHDGDTEKKGEGGGGGKTHNQRTNVKKVRKGKSRCFLFFFPFILSLTNKKGKGARGEGGGGDGPNREGGGKGEEKRRMV